MSANWRRSCRAKCSAVILLATFTFSACNEDSGSEIQSQTPPTGPGDSDGGNNAPTISGSSPSSVKLGEDYSFQPNASDADGDTLTFSVEGKPDWAAFDSSTGGLSGTPEAGDEGTYDISISASDGVASDSLEFSVTVNQVALGSVTLSWMPPTLNDDGSALTDLAGYEIHYGVSPGNYTEEIRIDNPSLTTYVVENLSPNTYYFAATSFTADGTESSFSGVYSETVN